jgi:predicted nucleic acid-binding protein
MDRLFLDANILFSAAYRSGAGLLQLWKLSDAMLCSSRYALEEARINLADDDQKLRLIRLLETVHLLEASHQEMPRGISLPEKDVPIIFAAMEAHATHLLTGDVRHFGPYLGKKIEGVAIVLPGEYLRARTRKMRRD